MTAAQNEDNVDNVSRLHDLDEPPEGVPAPKHSEGASSGSGDACLQVLDEPPDGVTAPT